MNTDTKEFRADESLRLITDMIRQAQGKIQRNAFYFLLWGWVTVAGNIGMFLLAYFEIPRPYLSWLVAVPAWLITFYKIYSSHRTRGTKTHLDSVTISLWIAFGIVIVTMVAFLDRINYQINPMVLLIAAIPTFTSGVLIRFRPLVVGGISFWIFSIVSFLLPMYYQPLAGAAAIVVGYLIPGHLLRAAKD